MRKPTKCRSCNINYKLTGKTGKHYIVDTSVVCLVCKFFGKSVFHGEHEELCGETLECYSCHNYIQYTFGPDKIWKDEIYLPNDYLLIRDFEENKSYYSINDKKIITIGQIILFTDIDRLMNKLKTIVMFS